MKFAGNLYPIDDQDNILLTFRDFPTLEVQGSGVADAEEKAKAALVNHLTSLLDGKDIIPRSTLPLAGDAEIEVPNDLLIKIAKKNVKIKTLSEEDRVFWESVLNPQPEQEQ